MPYKVIGSTVYVKRNGRWQQLHRHANHGEAIAHLTALNINVKHKGK
jgi:hypothetical protein